MDREARAGIITTQEADRMTFRMAPWRVTIGLLFCTYLTLMLFAFVIGIIVMVRTGSLAHVVASIRTTQDILYVVAGVSFLAFLMGACCYYIPLILRVCLMPIIVDRTTGSVMRGRMRICAVRDITGISVQLRQRQEIRAFAYSLEADAAGRKGIRLADFTQKEAAEETAGRLKAFLGIQQAPFNNDSSLRRPPGPDSGGCSKRSGD